MVADAPGCFIPEPHETGFANVGKGANKLDYVLIHAMMTI
jgi:hypothetical protein